MRACALILLSHVVLLAGLMWCGVLAWYALRWLAGRYARVTVLHVSKRGLYDPRNQEDGCGD